MSLIENTIGNRLKAIRKEKNMSQEHLANEVFLDRSYIGRLEIGKANCTLKSLEIILQGLDITLYEFFNHPDFKEKSAVNENRIIEKLRK
jgi:transcriptional regulator with XRE-family HTH domain